MAEAHDVLCNFAFRAALLERVDGREFDGHTASDFHRSASHAQSEAHQLRFVPRGYGLLFDEIFEKVRSIALVKSHMVGILRGRHHRGTERADTVCALNCSCEK